MLSKFLVPKPISFLFIFFEPNQTDPIPYNPPSFYVKKYPEK